MNILEGIYPFQNKMLEVLLRESSCNFPDFRFFDQQSKFGGYAIGFFTIGGTGFVVRNENNKIIILTAAQVLLDSRYDLMKCPPEFCLGNSKFSAIPLKNSLDWTDISKFYVDPLTNVPISIPEDWLFCELVYISGNENIVALDIFCDQDLNIDDEVVVIGYPLKPALCLDYMAPSATVSETSELKDKIQRFNWPLEFSGKVLASDFLICANCSTIDGMPGSPLLKKVNGEYKVFGLLHGSRPSYLHHFVTRILKSFDSPDLNLLSSFLPVLRQKLNVVTGILFCVKIECYIRVIEKYLNNIATVHELYDLLNEIYFYANKIEEACGNSASYDTFISTKLFSYFLR